MNHRAVTVFISLEGGKPTLWDAPGKGRQEARFRLYSDGQFVIEGQERFGLVASAGFINAA